jgi:hypothetical protein
MTKHTPGPWLRGITLATRRTLRWPKSQWKGNDAIEQTMIFSSFKMEDEGKSRQLVATLNPLHPDYEANARLIAAAPELLKAAKAGLRYMERSGIGKTSHATNLRAAIAKATGEA